MIRIPFLDGWTGSMWVSAGIALAVAIVSMVWTPSRRVEHADAVVAADAVAA